MIFLIKRYKKVYSNNKKMRFAILKNETNKNKISNKVDK